MKCESRKTVSLAMPQELYDRLKELAKEDCRTIPSYIRQLIKTHLRTVEKNETPD